MIEDTLNANPGMRETYRAYGRVQHCFDAFVKAEAELEKLQAVGSAPDAVSKAEEHLFRLNVLLTQAHVEVQKCLENEKILRAKSGFPPLDKKVLLSAEEFLEKHKKVLKEKCSSGCD